MKELKYCYFHVQLRYAMPMTMLFLEENPYVPPGEIPVAGFQLPFLDDAAAIQVGFMQVIHGISHNRLNPRQARLILSALHGARSNLKQMDTAVASAQRPLLKAMERDAQKNESAQASVERGGQAPKKRPARVKDAATGEKVRA